MNTYNKALKRQRYPRYFIDGTDWKHNLISDSYGIKLYPSEETLEDGCGQILTDCGIVEVEVKFIRWVKPPKLGTTIRRIS
jgi:hypothetical protein